MPRTTLAVLLLATLFAADALAGKQLIIDVEAETRPKTHANKAAAAPVRPEILLVLSENETAHNLSPGIVEQLTALGYVLDPEIRFGRLLPKKPGPPDPKAKPDPKVALRFEIVRVSSSCFVTGRAGQFSDPDVSFFKYDTTDDSLPCTDQLKLAIAEFNKVRPPDKLPPGLDAGTPDASEAVALVESHPKLVLAPTLINTEGPAALGTDAPDAAAAPAPAAPAPAEPPKKKGCGCSSTGEAGTLVALAALIALRRR